MSRIDPWEKAADCERAIQAAADPQQKTILKNLRYLWIALANESECMSADEFAHESETIGRLHIALARSPLALAPLASCVRHHRTGATSVQPINSIEHGISAASPIRTHAHPHVGAKSAMSNPPALRQSFLCCTLATSYARYDARASPVMTTRPKTVE